MSSRLGKPARSPTWAIQEGPTGAEILSMENGSHSSVPSARFSTQGVTVEVECCPDDQGTWRARVLEPADRRGGWSHGARAWQAINAAVRGIDTYVEQTAP